MHQSEGDEETGDSCLRSQDQDAQIIPFGSPLKGPFPAFIPFCTPLQRLFHFSPLCSVCSMLATFAAFIPCWPLLQPSFAF